MSKVLPKLEPVLHQPVRTRLVVALKSHGEISFTSLKAVLGVTDGNLDSHLKKLTAAGFIHTRFVSDGRPKTLFSLSPSGLAAVSSYFSTLSDLMALSAP
jgi:predicted ArsR family transcriptional regulator